MADALLLSSARAVPRRLEETGYRFRFPELTGALRHMVAERETP
jgi:NAD dependent epimerase/dehydratase family enzyme